MIKLTFALHDWFSQDLVDAVGVFLDLQEDHAGKFTYALKRWAYTDYSEHKFYRKTILIEQEGKEPELKEWFHKPHLEQILGELLYEKEDV